jgi:hypothetical protein
MNMSNQGNGGGGSLPSLTAAYVLLLVPLLDPGRDTEGATDCQAKC